jgi:large subunit ribosomal protein L9
MKVILYKDVDKVGDADTLVEVSEGYARNYLIPKRLAGPATPAALAALAERQEKLRQEMEARRSELEALAQKISSLDVEIAAEAGEGGKLFGAVTSQDIAIEISKALGSEIDKKKVNLGDPIKVVGEYKVIIKLYQDITADLKLKVTPK